MPKTHIYQRSPIQEAEGNDSLAKLAKLILPNSKVLDIGCNYGALGQYLSQNKNCTVDGVDYNPEAIEIAKTHLNQAIVVDLENQNLNDILNQKYDYIVCADVLEHLKDPGKTLKEIKDLLNENGKLLISIPNIAYIGVILGLMSGNFRYTHEGILDNTHLRFFTKRSFNKLLCDNEFFPKIVNTVIMPIEESEFSLFIDTKQYEKLFAELKTLENPLVYQYIIEAGLTKSDEHNLDLEETLYDEPALVYNELVTSLMGKVYWQFPKTDFSEEQSLSFRVPLAAEKHKITLNLPANIAVIRLDPCRKPSFIKLYSISIKDKATNKLEWEWDGKAKSLAQFSHQSLFITQEEDNQVILATIKEDSHLVFNFNKVFDNELILEIEMSWPKSPEYFLIKDSLKGIDKQFQEYEAQLTAANQNINYLNGELNDKNENINYLNAEIINRNETITGITKTLEEKYHEINALTKTLEEKYQEINALTKNIEERYLELSNLHEELTAKNMQIDSLQHEDNINKEKINQQHWEIEDLKAKIAQKSQHIENLNHEIAQVHTNINNIVTSKSWVITKPLRFILRNLKNANSPDTIPIATKIDNSNDTVQEFIAEPYDNPTIKSNSYYETLFNDNNNPSKDYKEFKQYPDLKTTIKAIAFYLPQYHPIPENDLWWGKGFTEWTNVSKAIPQFDGHYQPRLPGELGFYDLRLKDIMKRQIKLAKNYGIYGFCFHYYWFGGKKLLEMPIENYLADKSLDFKFCLNWANENWSRRWDGKEDDILIGQNHSVDDDINFIKEMTKYFKDERYIRINGKPLLMVYRPDLFPDPKQTASRWREYCHNNGIGEIYLVSTHSFDSINPLDFGFDACTEFAPNNMKIDHYNLLEKVNLLSPNFKGGIYDYLAGLKHCDEYLKPEYTKFRGICPSWDNEARKPGKGVALHNANPHNYELWLNNICDFTNNNFKGEEKLIFINAWNEWAEGAVLEPDRKYGYAYLDSTYKILSSFTDK